ncbi:16S rRNA (guanine(966)-N(2))-methyltransferase RsmD [Gulosibacter molinativorax]|nr:16S rRNA (guanine(966)-N(2))-methyltransferase RsmD [Gulosibacter molinativorax]QUY62453.1 Ribosomal RNA small subunit methyltransferase D [Gulosibacter molinativorax]
MTRIIAGAAGGTVLRASHTGTRPTSDRVREALFSALESAFEFEGARVLDLYAGSGALGFESLSRGAESLTLVERSGSVCRIAQRNLAALRPALGEDAQVTIVESATRSWLGTARGEFDLVFLDPPYELSNADCEADLALLAPRLSEGALVVVERSTRSGDLALPEGLRLWRRRDYGDTALHFIEPAE